MTDSRGFSSKSEENRNMRCFCYFGQCSWDQTEEVVDFRLSRPFKKRTIWNNFKGRLLDLVCGAVMSMMSDSSSEPVLCSSCTLDCCCSQSFNKSLKKNSQSISCGFENIFVHRWRIRRHQLFGIPHWQTPWAAELFFADPQWWDWSLCWATGPAPSEATWGGSQRGCGTEEAAAHRPEWQQTCVR